VNIHPANTMLTYMASTLTYQHCESRTLVVDPDDDEARCTQREGYMKLNLDNLLAEGHGWLRMVG
jgi:hypothetical protein